jgi:hypothetical protein
MTRLALARTLVTGTVTLQGNSFTFTASGSGTATGDKVPEAKKLAIAASNTAAIAEARASIDQILLNNSAVLSDLEITSLISNNLSTTVIVYRPLALSKIATTTDGINYTLIKDTIIGARDWVTVHNGTTFKTGKYHLTNNGFFEIGDRPGSVSTTLKTNDTTASVEYNYDCSNNGYYQVYYGTTWTLDAGYTFENYAKYSDLNNSGICDNSGNIVNSGDAAGVMTFPYGVFNNYDGATITNSGEWSYVENQATFTNYSGATITNSGENSSFGNYSDGLVVNDGTINNSNSTSYTGNYGGWTGSGACYGTCYYT